MHTSMLFAASKPLVLFNIYLDSELKKGKQQKPWFHLAHQTCLHMTVELHMTCCSFLDPNCLACC